MSLLCDFQNRSNYDYETLFKARLREFNDPDNYYLGVELETEPRQYGSDYDRGECISPNLYATSDGSLSYDGVEFKNAPMTFTYLMRNRETEWDTVLNAPYMEVDSSCGIHIHVSQSAFRDWKHVFRFCRFVHGNNNFTFWFSGRSERRFDQWAGWDRRYMYPGVKARDLLHEGQIYNGRQNHVIRATGCTCTSYSTVIDQARPYESRTMEVRLFDATLNHIQFYANIQFMRALVEFTRSPLRTNLSVKAFRRYVGHRKELYPDLNTRLMAYHDAKNRIEVACS